MPPKNSAQPPNVESFTDDDTSRKNIHTTDYQSLMALHGERPEGVLSAMERGDKAVDVSGHRERLRQPTRC